MKGKKGQESGTGKEIAILILLIGVFMVLYVLLLPPADREKLLNETTTNATVQGVSTVLLSEVPGEIAPITQSSIVHDITPINIFVKTEPTTVNLANTLTITKNLISQNSQTLTFSVEDVSNLKDVTLFFSVKDASGTLSIKLNNNLVFYDQISPGDVKLISLPVNYIQNSNIVEISVSSPGFFFWQTNKYVLENVGIKENFEKINPKEERVIDVSQSEINNLQKSTLNYYLYCNSLQSDNALLKVYFNDNQVLSSVISCVGTASTLEIPKSSFNQGENKLTFSIDKGDFTISTIKLNNQLTANVENTYHFSLLGQNYNNVASGVNGVKLALYLESNNTKNANILVNGQSFSMSTTDTSYNLDITKYVNQGDNVIRIDPLNTFTVNLLQVGLS